jgi:hypothetical protein
MTITSHGGTYRERTPFMVDVTITKEHARKHLVKTIVQLMLTSSGQNAAKIVASCPA